MSGFSVAICWVHEPCEILLYQERHIEASSFHSGCVHPAGLSLSAQRIPAFVGFCQTFYYYCLCFLRHGFPHVQGSSYGDISDGKKKIHRFPSAVKFMCSFCSGKWVSVFLLKSNSTKDHHYSTHFKHNRNWNEQTVTYTRPAGLGCGRLNTNSPGPYVYTTSHWLSVLSHTFPSA